MNINALLNETPVAKEESVIPEEWKIEKDLVTHFLDILIKLKKENPANRFIRNKSIGNNWLSLTCARTFLSNLRFYKKMSVPSLKNLNNNLKKEGFLSPLLLTDEIKLDLENFKKNLDAYLEDIENKPIYSLFTTEEKVKEYYEKNCPVTYNALTKHRPSKRHKKSSPQYFLTLAEKENFIYFIFKHLNITSPFFNLYIPFKRGIQKKFLEITSCYDESADVSFVESFFTALIAPTIENDIKKYIKMLIDAKYFYIMLGTHSNHFFEQYSGLVENIDNKLHSFKEFSDIDKSPRHITDEDVTAMVSENTENELTDVTEFGDSEFETEEPLRKKQCREVSADINNNANTSSAANFNANFNMGEKFIILITELRNATNQLNDNTIQNFMTITSIGRDWLGYKQAKDFTTHLKNNQDVKLSRLKFLSSFLSNPENIVNKFKKYPLLQNKIQLFITDLAKYIPSYAHVKNKRLFIRLNLLKDFYQTISAISFIPAPKINISTQPSEYDFLYAHTTTPQEKVIFYELLKKFENALKTKLCQKDISQLVLNKKMSYFHKLKLFKIIHLEVIIHFFQYIVANKASFEPTQWPAFLTEINAFYETIKKRFPDFAFKGHEQLAIDIAALSGTPRTASQSLLPMMGMGILLFQSTPSSSSETPERCYLKHLYNQLI